MGLRSWVNLQGKTTSRVSLPMGSEGRTTDSGSPQEIGLINSQQSVLTFAGAPAAISLMWKVLCQVWPALASEQWVVLVLSLAAGVLIYSASAPGSGTRGSIIRGFIFSIINSFSIAAAALGITTITA